jgi:hypothetical protein
VTVTKAELQMHITAQNKASALMRQIQTDLARLNEACGDTEARGRRLKNASNAAINSSGVATTANQEMDTSTPTAATSRSVAPSRGLHGASPAPSMPTNDSTKAAHPRPVRSSASGPPVTAAPPTAAVRPPTANPSSALPMPASPPSTPMMSAAVAMIPPPAPIVRRFAGVWSI